VPSARKRPIVEDPVLLAIRHLAAILENRRRADVCSMGASFSWPR
jgi:hypothetical protein